MWGNFLNIYFEDTLEEALKRQSGVGADGTTKNNSKYESDIKALKQKYGDSLSTGICIETTLKEILELCPRVRHRSDAYQGLVSYLKKIYGITLTIKSQKTKPEL